MYLFFRYLSEEFQFFIRLVPSDLFFWVLCTVANTNEEDREINSISDLKEGDIIRGFVKSCSDVGVFVR